jgi:hypothetical protein
MNRATDQRLRRLETVDGANRPLLISSSMPFPDDPGERALRILKLEAAGRVSRRGNRVHVRAARLTTDEWVSACRGGAFGASVAAAVGA